MRLIVTFLALMAAPLFAADSPLYTIPLKDIDGKGTSLQAYAGKALLVVNVASECGYTAQYAGLEALWRKYKDKGLVVLGFPCNDFGGQEPGSAEEIKKFCTSKYDVTFPMFDKVSVKGEKQHPLFTALSGPASPFPGNVKWNFGKFLIGRDGKLVSRYGSDTEPESPEMEKAVEAALAVK